ncbi:cation efflux protein [Leucosporidium creatinivorum]|uniref:Cation efflux protein n=1 Tax=Leucosporidium creatinivorum TaxID=106004 RepID=A0A1Y2D6B9_9BASI|nr:cation efflux protein [Leucosporidium creatinivorum]
MSNRGFKLKLLLAIDTAFLLLELGVGTAVGSLALVADSFHMLNDVCSLLVAMQAMKLAEKGTASDKYSYGWQRAEVLGALINAVFLLALCFSIGLEAIARFISGAEVTNPQLIVVVGAAGLLSNIVGLFLFHDHGGHSHGGGGHSHGGGGGHAGHGHGDVESGTKVKKAKKTPTSYADAAASATDRTPLLTPNTASTSTTLSPPTETDDEDEDDEPEDELYVHPGALRENIVKHAHEQGYGAHSHTPKKGGDHSHGNGEAGHGHSHGDEEEEDDHEVAASGRDGGMNDYGVWLHVMGDALGNIGVIAAGLFIWLTDYSWRMYSDPAVSLVITCIIFSSALPLTKSASFILLQGVPSSIPLDRLRSAIAAVPGVHNVHELHVWSLSESKSVASVHVMTNEGDFVEVSSKIRRVMHRFGIHSSTIQPEIVNSKASVASHISAEAAASIAPEQEGCLVLCADDSCRESSCCPPVDQQATTPPAQ